MVIRSLETRCASRKGGGNRRLVNVTWTKKNKASEREQDASYSGTYPLARLRPGIVWRSIHTINKIHRLLTTTTSF